MWLELLLSPSGGRKALDQQRLLLYSQEFFIGSGSKTVKQGFILVVRLRRNRVVIMQTRTTWA